MAKQKSPAEFLHEYLHISGYLEDRGNTGRRDVSVDIVMRLQAGWLRKRNLILSRYKKILLSPKRQDWL